MNMMGFRSIGMARGGVVQPNSVVRGNVAHPGGVPGGSKFMGASSPLMQLFRDYYVAPDKTAAQVPAQAPAQVPAQAPALVARNASVDSGALDRFRREFGREPRDTAELQEYMISGGGVVTPMRDGGMMGFRPVGYDQGGEVPAEAGRRESLIRQIIELSGITNQETLTTAQMSLQGQDTNSLQNTLNVLIARKQAEQRSTMQGSPVGELTTEQRRQLDELPSQTDFMGRPMTPQQQMPGGNRISDSDAQNMQKLMPFTPPQGGLSVEDMLQQMPFTPPQGGLSDEDMQNMRRLLPSEVPQKAYGGIMSLRR